MYPWGIREASRMAGDCQARATRRLCAAALRAGRAKARFL